MIRAEAVCMNYQQAGTEIPVLKDLSFESKEGETLAILGESGSGKSTLLSLLSGLATPQSGRILVNEKNLALMDEAKRTQFRGEKIGIVFQQYHLLPYMTALENVELPLEINGQTENLRERAKKALEDVGLGHRLSHFPHQLSGGECQRVAIARALISKPQVLLADEPSGNLDSRTGAEVMQLLFDLVKEHKITTLLVTHNRELSKLCDRRLELRAGKLHPMGTDE